VLGLPSREALLANFNSVFFFASRETALDAQALLTLGTKEVRPRIASFGDLGDHHSTTRLSSRQLGASKTASGVCKTGGRELH
jgi:hypothetical protein